MDTAPTPDVRNPQAEMPQVHAASLNRRLAVAVAVLTVAVAGLGAALIVEFGSEQAPRAGETPAQAYRGRSHVYAQRADTTTVALVDAFLAAYNAGDAEGIASLWRPDSVLYDTNFWVAPVGLVNPKRLTNERGDVERVSRVNQTGEFGGSSSVLVMFTVKVGGGHRSTWIPGMVHDAGQDPEHGDPLS